MDDAELSSFLKHRQKLAIMGMSPDPSLPSHSIPKFLEEKGHEIIPIHPILPHIGHWKSYRKLDEVDGISGVLIYFSPRNVDRAVQEAINLKIPVVWLPLGVTNGLKEQVEAQGLSYVEDKCPKIE